MEKTDYIGAFPLQNREERKESRWGCSRMVSNALHLMLCRWCHSTHTLLRAYWMNIATCLLCFV